MYRDGGRPKGSRQLFNCIPDSRGIADVGRQRQGLSARSLNLLSNKDASGSVTVENADRGSLGGKPDCDSTANSIPCAGNYGYSFVKPHHADPDHRPLSDYSFPTAFSQ
jgi:hypothetical protein